MIQRICIVTQSHEFASSAGMRVRYARFISGSANTRAEIFTKPIAEVDHNNLDADTYIFCKTFTAAALLLAATLRRSGKLVGNDFFDDYFSQADDQRLAMNRNWIRQIAPLTDFCICTTTRMQSILEPFFPSVPIVVIGDPFDSFDLDIIVPKLERQVTAWSESRVIRLAWFGIGDNPFFPVGLADLAAPGTVGDLAYLIDQGWSPQLTVATNVRALDVDTIERLKRLSVPFTVIEWTEEAESELLRSSDVVVIPVNVQPFSRAKSLNRAVSALSYGCQVLSLGFNLYSELDDYIYRSVEELDASLQSSKPKLNTENAGALADQLARMADPDVLAARFVSTATAAKRPANQKLDPPVVLHGRQTSIELHKIVASVGGLSIRTPFTRAQWNFPVRFDVDKRRMIVRMTPSVAQGLKHAVAASGPTMRIGDLDYVALDGQFLPISSEVIAFAKMDSDELVLSVYATMMAKIRDTCAYLFPNADIIISDSHPIHRAIPRAAA